MPINASGAISLGASTNGQLLSTTTTTRLNSVANRLFVADGSALDMNNATLRATAGVGGSGTAYSLSNFYSKPSWAYSNSYDCSSFSGWNTSINTTGGSARFIGSYGGYHWQMYADGNSVPWVFQERNFGEATAFDIQIDYMMNTADPQFQFQLATTAPVYTNIIGTIYNWVGGLVNGGGFRCTGYGLDYCGFSSNTDNGTVGGNLITWYYGPCATNNTSTTVRYNKWTRLRFVGYKSSGNWYGTVYAYGIDSTETYVTLGSASFGFVPSGNAIAIRTHADNDGGNNDGSGTSLFIDSVWVTLD
jgi:hypothetical protein